MAPGISVMPSVKWVKREKTDDSSPFPLVLLPHETSVRTDPGSYLRVFSHFPQGILEVKMKGLGLRDAHAFLQLERRPVPPGSDAVAGVIPRCCLMLRRSTLRPHSPPHPVRGARRGCLRFWLVNLSVLV